MKVTQALVLAVMAFQANAFLDSSSQTTTDTTTQSGGGGGSNENTQSGGNGGDGPSSVSGGCPGIHLTAPPGTRPQQLARDDGPPLDHHTRHMPTYLWDTFR